jgi:hypothetical protein
LSWNVEEMGGGSIFAAENKFLYRRKKPWGQDQGFEEMSFESGSNPLFDFCAAKVSVLI